MGGRHAATTQEARGSVVINSLWSWKSPACAPAARRCSSLWRPRLSARAAHAWLSARPRSPLRARPRRGTRPCSWPTREAFAPRGSARLARSLPRARSAAPCLSAAPRLWRAYVRRARQSPAAGSVSRSSSRRLRLCWRRPVATGEAPTSRCAPPGFTRSCTRASSPGCQSSRRRAASRPSVSRTSSTRA